MYEILCLNRDFTTLAVPSQPTPSQPSMLELAAQKIRKLIKRIWKDINRMLESFPRLSNEDITLIQSIKRNHLAPLKPEVIQQSSPEKIRRPEPILENIEKPEEPELADFCDLIVDFAEILVNDCAYEKEIEPHGKEWKEKFLDSIDKVKASLDIIVNIQQSVFGFAEKFHFNDFKDATPTIIFQLICQVLLPGKSKEILAEELKKGVEQLLQENKISKQTKEKIDINIPRIISWLYNSNNWLLNTNQPLQLHHLFLDISTFIDSLGNLIKDGKLDEKIDGIKKEVGNGFEEDIHEFLELNTNKIALGLAVHFSDLLKNLSYSKMMDKFLETFNKHLKGWKQGNEKFKEHENLILRSQDVAASSARSGSDFANQKEGCDLIDIVNKEGGEKIYLEKKFHEAFFESSACHPIFSQEKGLGDEKNISKMEKEFYSWMIKKIFPCMLPNKKVALPNGEIEFNGLITLLDGLELPKRWQNCNQIIEEIWDMALKNGEYNKPENFKAYFFTILKCLTTEVIRDLAEDAMVSYTQKKLNLISSPEFFEYFAVNILFPMQLDKSFAGWTRFAIARNSKEAAVYFHALVEKEAQPIKYINPNEALLSYLNRVMKNSLRDFNFEEGGITDDKFRELIQPLIDEICDHLNEFKDSKNGSVLSVDMISLEINEYLKVQPVKTQKIYGDITLTILKDVSETDLVEAGEVGNFFNNIFNTMFGIENLQQQIFHKVLDNVKEDISQEASNMMDKWCSSYHFPLANLIDFGGELIDNRDKLMSLFFPEESLETVILRDKELTKNTFSSRLQILSKLWHDALYYNLDSLSEVLPLQRATPTYQKLNQLVGEVFYKLTSRQILNKSFLFRNTEVLVHFLDEAATASENALT